MTWQDISTAPKDGTEILGYRSDCDVILIRYTSMDAFLTESEMDGYDEETIFKEDWFFADFVKGGRLQDDEVPTHWMPLPSPPQSRRQDEEPALAGDERSPREGNASLTHNTVTPLPTPI